MALPHRDEHSLDTLLAQAKHHHGQKNFASAADLYQRILQQAPDRASARENLARCHISLGRGEEAVSVFYQMARAQATERRHKTMLAYALQSSGAFRQDTLTKNAIILCLSDPQLHHEWVYPAWIAYLKGAQEFNALWQPIDFTKISIDMLNDPLLLLGLTIFRAADAGLERFFTNARSSLLDMTLDNPVGLIPYKKFLSALADQCFHTDYAYAQTDHELQKLTRLGYSQNDLLIYACYRPLYTLKHHDRIFAQTHDDLTDIIEQQLIEPLEEERIKADIIAVGTIADTVSQTVRAQYETHPYPRWKNANLPNLRPNERAQRILIAGCGTGRQVAYTAQMFPNADITAIDLSTTSLAFAIRQGEKMGYNARVTYRHMDILDLPRLGKNFDLIFCTGVLHHMDAPMAGWRALCAVAAPDATMKIGLYSALARRDINAVRASVQNYPSTDDGIRTCRQDLMQSDEWKNFPLIPSSMDFYSLSACRDLLFHVQEHQFTLPQIKDCLAALDLEFLRFDFTNPRIAQTYQERFPNDPAMSNLNHWHDFECDNPDIFGEMYQFHVQKRGNQPAN